MKYKVGDKITQVKYNTLNSEVSKIKFTKHTLRMEKKFYSSKSEMPRLKFKKNYPNNKIVYDIDEADIFILAENNIYNYISFSNWNMGSYHQLTEKVIDAHDINTVNNLFLVSKINHIGKPIIRDSEILYKGEIPREMSTGEYLSISRMMSSGEKEMMNLGLEMLLGFDHSMNEERYVLILAQTKNSYMLKKSRTFKAIKKTLSLKYVNLR